MFCFVMKTIFHKKNDVCINDNVYTNSENQYSVYLKQV